MSGEHACFSDLWCMSTCVAADDDKICHDYWFMMPYITTRSTNHARLWGRRGQSCKCHYALNLQLMASREVECAWDYSYSYLLWM